jgi:soluble P-type ATPase
MMITIPNYHTLDMQHIVCDYNGTIAKDGTVLLEIKELFAKLKESYKIYVITADTFGSVHQQLDGYGVEIVVLSSENHTQEKADFVTALGASSCVSLGNGNNDASMLKTSAIGIALLGDEGCSRDALFASDIVCKSISEALMLLLNPKRLIATLRR